MKKIRFLSLYIAFCILLSTFYSVLVIAAPVSEDLELSYLTTSESTSVSEGNYSYTWIVDETEDETIRTLNLNLNNAQIGCLTLPNKNSGKLIVKITIEGDCYISEFSEGYSAYYRWDTLTFSGDGELNVDYCNMQGAGDNHIIKIEKDTTVNIVDDNLVFGSSGSNNSTLEVEGNLKVTGNITCGQVIVGENGYVEAKRITLAGMGANDTDEYNNALVIKNGGKINLSGDELQHDSSGNMYAALCVIVRNFDGDADEVINIPEGYLPHGYDLVLVDGFNKYVVIDDGDAFNPSLPENFDYGIIGAATSFELPAQMVKKEDVSVNENVQEYIYNGQEREFSIEANVDGGFDVTYMQDNKKVNPVNAGTYDVVIKRAEDSEYNTYSKIIDGGLVVAPLAVDILWSKEHGFVYDGTEKKISATVANKIGNDEINITFDGTVFATEKGDYTATVINVDNENYTLDGGKNLSKHWTISEIANEWIQLLSIEDWVYGDTAKEPVALAKYGTPVYTYSDSANGEYTQSVPTEAGVWYVKATVEGTENYTELSDVKEFTIHKKTIGNTIPLDVPKAQNTPITKLETDEYYASVEWSPEVTDKYKYSIVYTATIKITPKTNYTVEGIKENSYVVKSAKVENDANSGIITAVFTKTGDKSSGESSGRVRTLYTLAYETNGGSEIPTMKYNRGSNVSLSAIPEKEGYLFGGWHLDEELTNYVEKVKITKDTTVYALWVEKGIKLNSEEHVTYIFGYPDNTVRPEANITRSEVTAIFYRLLNKEVVDEYFSATNNFGDVEKDDWYNIAVSTMANIGIVKGRDALVFAPDKYITRGEFAAICARFDDSEYESDLTFTDIEGHWAKQEIIEAAAHGWINGYEDLSFKPDRFITRAEAITMINRMLNRIPQSEEDLLDGMIQWSDNSDKEAWYYLAVQEATNNHEYMMEENNHEKWTKLKE